MRHIINTIETITGRHETIKELTVRILAGIVITLLCLISLMSNLPIPELLLTTTLKVAIFCTGIRILHLLFPSSTFTK